jgi:hypothetical protein
MKKGAQPTDRVMRFLDAAGVAKREKRNNPEKAIPRKERKATAEAKVKDAEAAARRRQDRQKPPRRKLPRKPPRPPKRRRADALITRGRDDRSGLRGADWRAAWRAWGGPAVDLHRRPDGVTRYAPLQTEDGKQAFEIEAVRPAKGHLVARLRGIDTREAAERLTNIKLFVPRERLPEIEADEFYHADLVGLRVEDETAARSAR